jgi:uncharacterized protein with PIN domain
MCRNPATPGSANVTGEPLLFEGDDFAHTDIDRARR